MTERTATPGTGALPGAEQRQQGQPRLGLALLVIVMAQLMVVLDATIVTTALPRIQDALHLSGTGLQWVVTGYSITFGGLMLLGGRAGDLLGRKKVFITGLVLFSAASLAGGLAQNGGTLLAMRVVQGTGAALIAPTALALITTTFPAGRQLNRAMGVYAAMSGSGAAIGVVLGGLLTTYVSWRWVLIVNVPIGVVTALAATRVLPETRRSPGRLDLPGAIVGTLGVAALVFGLSSAPAQSGGPSHWGSPQVIVALAAAVVLLPAFVAIEHRSAQPLLPLRVLTDRTRGGSYLNMLLLVTGSAGTFFFMTLFLQDVRGYSPIECGLAFLPYAVVMVAVSEVTSRVVGQIGPRTLMIAGGLLSIGGTFWYAMITDHSSYVGGMLGPLLLTSAGFGLVFVPMTLTGTAGVAPEDAGVAASLLNTGQQVGIAIGLAILGTVAWTVVANSVQAQLAAHPGLTTATTAITNHALASGFSRGFFVAAGITVLALIVVVTMVCPARGQARDGELTPVACPNTHWRRPRKGDHVDA